MKDRTEFKEYDKEKEQYSNKDPLSYGDEIEDDILEECLGMEEENDDEDDIDSPIDTELLDQLMNMGYPDDDIDKKISREDILWKRLSEIKEDIGKVKDILDSHTYSDINNIVNDFIEKSIQFMKDLVEYRIDTNCSSDGIEEIQRKVVNMNIIKRSIKYSLRETAIEFIKIIENE